jgi:hypothetical protein
MFRRSEYEEMLRFEQKAYMQFEEPGNDGIDRTPEKCERDLDYMEKMETPWQREGEEY